ncbi:MAG: hypothetical protein RL367_2810 [Pseudomonadota bacterium]
MENSRNMILAVLLSALVLFGGNLLTERFFPQPKTPPAQIAPVPGTSPAAPPAAPAKPVAASAIIATTARVRIVTAKLNGSINLTGARLDDLTLTQYRQTIQKDAPAVRLLSPQGTAEGYAASLGWIAAAGIAVPDANTVWQADGTQLSTGKPVTLSWDNGAGLTFQQRFAVDENYLFTVDQNVINHGTAPVLVRTTGLISRTIASTGKEAAIYAADGHGTSMIHIGPVGVFGNEAHYKINYSDLDEQGDTGQRFTTKGGWLGFGETYWLAAFIPSDKTAIDAGFHAAGGQYLADYKTGETSIAPGATATTSARLFAGAKEIKLLDRYEEAGIPKFSLAVDWGWFEIIEKPIFTLLHWLFGIVGNFGVAIIALTFIVRGAMFPVVQRQFASMARMRSVQPKMKQLQERYKDDKERLQKETMALYSKEKINPLGGCLPIFLQMPVFYGLFKVLNLSIEMRHQPFALWVHDLSAPDPATVLNLFHYLPFEVHSFFAIGVLPILLGVTMYFQFKLNPAPMDPAQAQVFAFMPWVMMFMMAPFAAGLQLYWIVSNILTIAQQKWLYSRQDAAAAEPAKT